MSSENVRNPSPIKMIPPRIESSDDSETETEASHIVVDDGLSDETIVETRDVGVYGASVTRSTRLEVDGANGFCRDPNN